MTSFEDPAADVDVEMDGGGRRMRGRGGDTLAADSREQYRGQGGVFDSVPVDAEGSSAARSIEGWIVFVKNVHPEAAEEDVIDLFSEYGEVQNFRMSLDRRTCFVKGYALVEYNSKAEAKAAIEQMDGAEFMEKKLHADWAFLKTGPAASGRRR